MSAKQIDIECPCCRARLAVDVLTRQVVRAAPPEKQDDAGRTVVDPQEFDRALERVQRRAERGEQVFDGALEREQRRDRDLDELFRRASDKARRAKDVAEPDSGESDPGPASG